MLKILIILLMPSLCFAGHIQMMHQAVIAKKKPSAWYRFESGAIGTDSIGSNTLTNSGAASETGDYKEGSGCADFELDDSDYMEAADNSFSLPWSITFWLKAESSAGVNSNYMWSKYATAGDLRTLGIVLTDSSGFWGFFAGYNTGQNYDPYASDASVTSGRWYFLGFSLDSSYNYILRVWDDTASALVDMDSGTGGHQDLTGTLGNSISIRNAPIRIGSRGDGTREFDGLIDDMKIHSKALSTGEIDSLR